MIPSLGELAALITSVCFSATSTFFTLAGRLVGSVTVNRTRLILAILFLSLTHLVVLGTPLPQHAGAERWFWFSISGVIGLVLGDAFLFQAFVWIGPRLSMLLMSLAPVMAALLAWAFLAESLTGGQITGMTLALGGVAWVIRERDAGDRGPKIDRRNYLWGIVFGMGAAAGQALGLITAKKGLTGDFSALSGTLIRMLTAAACLWGYTLLRGQARDSIRQLVDQRKAVLFILGGAFTGPFLGVTASLFAIQRTPVGVASTLMALPPIFLLPVGYLVFQERFGWQAIAGTLLAILGVALLFLS